MKKFIVDNLIANKTIKEYLSEQAYSSSQIKRLKYDGQILVNGEIVTVRYLLKMGDVVELVTNNRLKTPNFATEKAEILFADDWLYIANKAYGIATHPDRTHTSDTLGNMLATTFGNGFELRIVTRLDKTTSGLVLGAFDEVTAEKLNAMQQSHKITKQYIAQVEGILDGEGCIDLPLLRLDGENKTVVDEKGKAATTKYQVIRRGDSSAIVRLYPLTGRTHQIRAHLSAIGHPIVGDALYGSKNAERIMLHCERLTFVHPYGHNTVDITAPCEFLEKI